MSEAERAEYQSSWQARPYQQDALDQFDAGKRRQILIWHRRAGKDNFGLNLADRESRSVVGTYWHLFPTQVGAKRAIWNGIDKTGTRFIDQAFGPRDGGRRTATRAQDMQIEFDNGSMWQLCGSDAYDRLVGSNPRGVVFSEWALCDPRAWDYIRPIIRENKGWAAFITTYRGRNHAFRMAQRLKNHPDWFVDVRTVDDTSHSDGRPILTPEDIQAERDEGMSEPLIRQEYYCDPVAAAEGSVYGRELEKLLTAGRMQPISYDSSKMVFASWSLKFDNQYTVIFWQRIGNESHVIGSKSFPFWSLGDCLDYVSQHYPWKYISRHLCPADTPAETCSLFEDRGLNVDQVADSKIITKISRESLATVFIDNSRRPWEDKESENNTLFVDALNGYRFAQNSKRSEYTSTFANTWEKHYAHAFETFAVWSHNEPANVGGWHPRPSTAINDSAVI